MGHDSGPVTKQEYEALAGVRYGLRKFLRFSESAARQHGITPQQHQLLLAVKGFPGRDWANISELAERLQLRHQSVVGIIDRCARLGLVFRMTSPEDGRRIEIHLTDAGEQILDQLTRVHREELARLSQEFRAMSDLNLHAKP